MRAFERRWVRVILGSFVAEAGPGLAPRPGEVDFEDTFVGLRAHAPLLARIGLRAALWLVTLSPLWLTLRPRLLTQLPLAARQALLETLLAHRWLAVREAAFMLKVAACLALFASDDLRVRSGYDGASPSLRKPQRARGLG